MKKQSKYRPKPVYVNAIARAVERATPIGGSSYYTDILRDAEDLLREAASEIEAVERLVQRNFPDFQHPLLAKIRDVI